MSLATLTTTAKFNRDVYGQCVDEAVKYSPEVGSIGWRTVVGTWYDTLKRTANPTVAFRSVNTGATATSGTYDNVQQLCKFVNAQAIIDKAVANSSAMGRDVFIAAELQAQSNAIMSHIGSQVWYGVSNDAGGFPGLQAQCDNTMLVDATGTSAGTGSSVYILYGNNIDNLCGILGQDGNLTITDVREQFVADVSGNHFDAYVIDIAAWVGLALGHTLAVSRIHNLTPETGKGLTDKLIDTAVSLAPSYLGDPSGIYMTRRSRKQLRQSRTATTTTGEYAQQVKEWDGIPIFVTENLTNTETIVSGGSGS